jgi:hypothetical protein
MRVRGIGSVLVVVGVVIATLGAGVAYGTGSNAKVLAFDTMVGVPRPFTGSAHPIRGVNGGGLPWVISDGHGELRADGRLEVRVRGLVLDSTDAAVIAAGLAGKNPIAQFKAVVSCLTPASPDTGVTVSTGLFPATPTGDSDIEATVALPSPCIAPIVFVTSPSGAWFATTGR